MKTLIQNYTRDDLPLLETREEISEGVRNLIEEMFDLFSDIWAEEIDGREDFFLEGIENVVSKNLFNKLWLNREEELREN